ncbi:hypothetical protein M378DRAFT_959242 [Amanita muscaria Koide BX008]|uniref:Uncharacterized protein n=1 Tax=Amanita muscaria (strain Koide BX008) TaxID=946122 RepID=A0A0C2WF20_AMAMK|nr:hypothetical protein M378DRAFT_959242 [Amanita muscaria Koide BX008]
MLPFPCPQIVGHPVKAFRDNQDRTGKLAVVSILFRPVCRSPRQEAVNHSFIQKYGLLRKGFSVIAWPSNYKETSSDPSPVIALKSTQGARC